MLRPGVVKFQKNPTVSVNPTVLILWEYRGKLTVISSRFSVFGLKFVSFQFIGYHEMDDKRCNRS